MSEKCRPSSRREEEWAEHHFSPIDDVRLQDPYPIYEKLREHCPVARSDAHEGGFWVLSRYEDVRQALRDHERFTSGPSISIPALGTRRRLIPLEIDPPRHSVFRTLLNPYFAPARVAALEPQIRAITVDLLEAMRAKGGGDVVAEFCFRQPVMTVWRRPLLGEPVPIPGRENEDRPLVFQEWVHDLKHVPERSAAAATEIRQYLQLILDDRKAAPQDDIPTMLRAAVVDDKRLEDDEILDVLFLLFMGGVETPAGALANMFLFLVTHPTEADALRVDQSLIPEAIEEIIRLYGPSQGLRRTIAADLEVGGRQLQAGEPVLLLVNSASRDGEVFPDPDKFRLDRHPNRHMGFGAGIHRCIGAPLARVQMTIAMQEAFRLLPGMRLADDAPLQYSVGINRALRGLRIRLT